MMTRKLCTAIVAAVAVLPVTAMAQNLFAGQWFVHDDASPVTGKRTVLISTMAHELQTPSGGMFCSALGAPQRRILFRRLHKASQALVRGLIRHTGADSPIWTPTASFGCRSRSLTHRGRRKGRPTICCLALVPTSGAGFSRKARVAAARCPILQSGELSWAAQDVPQQ